MALALVFFCMPAHGQSAAGIPQRLAAAYPDQVTDTTGQAILIARTGTRIPCQDGRNLPCFALKLQAGDLTDQLELPYPAGWPFPVPTLDDDPGRVRCQQFFTAMYGATSRQVQKHLVRVPWLPAGPHQTVLFTRINGAASQLQRVSRQLGQLPPATRRYVCRPNGTFVWRTIAGTDRLSAHAWGIAIDFRLPASVYRYWKWDGCPSPGPCAYPRQVLADPHLARIIPVFEAHGFIWGGKWAHYDTMHFEYRPELLPTLSRP